jgi:DNA polymerase III subunit delta
MFPEELKRKISQADIAPLYFFYGLNSYLIDEILAQIISVLFASRAPDLDAQYYDAQTHAPPEILQAVRTMPFSSRRKLVVVKNAQAFKEAQFKKFQTYFAGPSAYCCCIFIYSVDPKDKKERTRAEAMKKFGAVIPFFNPQGEKQIGDFIKARLKAQGKEIAPKALDFFVATVGEDAQTIAGELEKLVHYCRARKKIDIDDIDDVVSCGSKGTIFALVDAVGQGNREKSIHLLGGLLTAGTYPLVILKMIARQFRLICMAREGMNAGESISRICQKLKLPEMVVKGVIQQARGWPAENMGKVFEELFQTNLMLKSSRVQDGIILENFLFKLAALRTHP